MRQLTGFLFRKRSKAAGSDTPFITLWHKRNRFRRPCILFSLMVLAVLVIAGPAYAKEQTNTPVTIHLNELSGTSSTGPGWTYTASAGQLTLTDAQPYILTGTNNRLAVQVEQSASVTLEGVVLQAPEGEWNAALWFMKGGTLTAQGDNVLAGGNGGVTKQGSGIFSNSNQMLDLVVQGSLQVSGGSPKSTIKGGDAISANCISVRVAQGGKLTLLGGNSQGNGGNGLGVYVGSLIVNNEGIILATGGTGNVSGSGLLIHESLAVTGQGTLTAKGSCGITMYGKNLQLNGGNLIATATEMSGISMAGSRDSQTRIVGNGSLTATGGSVISSAPGIGWSGTLELGLQGSLTAVGGLGDGSGSPGMSGNGLVITAAPTSLNIEPTKSHSAIAVRSGIDNHTAIDLSANGQGPIRWAGPPASTENADIVYWIGVGEANGMLHTAREQELPYAYSSRSGVTAIHLEALHTLDTTKLIHNTAGSSAPVQVTIPNPAQAQSDLFLSGRTSGQQVSVLQDRLSIAYANKTAVVCMDQQASWGQPVRIAAKLDLTGFDQDNLVIYSYHRESGKVDLLPQPAYNIDTNGYLHFTTEAGGDFIVSAGELQSASQSGKEA